MYFNTRLECDFGFTGQESAAFALTRIYGIYAQICYLIDALKVNVYPQFISENIPSVCLI